MTTAYTIIAASVFLWIALCAFCAVAFVLAGRADDDTRKWHLD